MMAEASSSCSASRPVITVAKAQIAVSETSGTSNSATIFLRMDFPRKRMASPTSSPRAGAVTDVLRQRAARAYYCGLVILKDGQTASGNSPHSMITSCRVIIGLKPRGMAHRGPVTVCAGPDTDGRISSPHGNHRSLPFVIQQGTLGVHTTQVPPCVTDRTGAAPKGVG